MNSWNRMSRASRKPDDAREVAEEILEALVDRTLTGDAGARRDLLILLTPWIQRCVAGTMTRHVAGGLRACSPEEIRDLSQDTLVRLMKDDHAVLRKWDRARGSLSTYVATVTHNLIVSHLRTKKKNPRTDNPLPDDPENFEGRDDELEMRLEAEDYERAVFARLEKRLGARGLTVLELTMQGRTIEEIARIAGMSRGAVSSHHSRIRQIAAAIRQILGR
jgi:RNA polymerase sigma factor (sigma-70 family)